MGFSLIEADFQRQYNHVIIFYGIEPVPESSVSKCRELSITYFFVEKKPGLDISSQKRVIQILQDVGPDVILLHSVNLIIPVYFYQLKQHIRVIAVEHQSNHLKTKKDWIWSVLIMLLAKKVVYLTEVYSDQMEKKLRPVFNKRKVAVINNGININLFQPPDTGGHGQKDPVKIGMLARLNGIKDHGTLIRSFKCLVENNPSRKFELYIAGEGEMKQSLQSLALKLGMKEKIHFLGIISETEVVKFLNEIDIYVHASLGETMSTSIMQAMACGKPIIASEVQGITNMVEEGKTGLLVPPLDPTTLALKLQALADDIDLQKSLGTHALQHAKLHFTNTSMLNSYINLFHD